MQRDVEQSGGSYVDYVSQARAFKDDDELLVFQRRPNWSVPLCNGPISDAEMDDLVTSTLRSETAALDSMAAGIILTNSLY